MLTNIYYSATYLTDWFVLYVYLMSADMFSWKYKQDSCHTAIMVGVNIYLRWGNFSSVTAHSKTFNEAFTFIHF